MVKKGKHIYMHLGVKVRWHSEARDRSSDRILKPMIQMRFESFGDSSIWIHKNLGNDIGDEKVN